MRPRLSISDIKNAITEARLAEPELAGFLEEVELVVGQNQGPSKSTLEELNRLAFTRQVCAFQNMFRYFIERADFGYGQELAFKPNPEPQFTPLQFTLFCHGKPTPVIVEKWSPAEARKLLSPEQCEELDENIRSDAANVIGAVVFTARTLSGQVVGLSVSHLCKLEEDKFYLKWERVVNFSRLQPIGKIRGVGQSLFQANLIFLRQNGYWREDDSHLLTNAADGLVDLYSASPKEDLVVDPFTGVNRGRLNFFNLRNFNGRQLAIYLGDKALPYTELKEKQNVDGVLNKSEKKNYRTTDLMSRFGLVPSFGYCEMDALMLAEKLITQGAGRVVMLTVTTERVLLKQAHSIWNNDDAPYCFGGFIHDFVMADGVVYDLQSVLPPMPKDDFFRLSFGDQKIKVKESTPAERQLNVKRARSLLMYDYEDFQALSINFENLKPVVFTPKIESRQAHVKLQLTDALHARPISLLIKIWNEYPDVKLFLTRGAGSQSKPVEIQKSILSLMMLVLKKGECIGLEATGTQAAEFLKRVECLNESNWSEQAQKRLPPYSFILTDDENATEQQIQKAFSIWNVPSLSAVYDAATNRIVFGPSDYGHDTLAKAFDISQQSKIRLVFTRDKKDQTLHLTIPHESGFLEGFGGLGKASLYLKKYFDPAILANLSWFVPHKPKVMAAAAHVETKVSEARLIEDFLYNLPQDETFTPQLVTLAQDDGSDGVDHLIYRVRTPDDLKIFDPAHPLVDQLIKASQRKFIKREEGFNLVMMDMNGNIVGASINVLEKHDINGATLDCQRVEKVAQGKSSSRYTVGLALVIARLIYMKQKGYWSSEHDILQNIHAEITASYKRAWNYPKPIFVPEFKVAVGGLDKEECDFFLSLAPYFRFRDFENAATGDFAMQGESVYQALSQRAQFFRFEVTDLHNETQLYPQVFKCEEDAQALAYYFKLKFPNSITRLVSLMGERPQDPLIEIPPLLHYESVWQDRRGYFSYRVAEHHVVERDGKIFDLHSKHQGLDVDAYLEKHFPNQQVTVRRSKMAAVTAHQPHLALASKREQPRFFKARLMRPVQKGLPLSSGNRITGRRF